MKLTNWFEGVSKDVLGTSRKRARRRCGSTILGLDALEPRVLLSANALVKDGTLFIRGDDAANDIHFLADDRGIHVTLDGKSLDFTGGVKSLDVQTLGGNDKVDFRQTTGSPLTQTSFNLGAGNDVASFSWGVTNSRTLPTDSLSLNFAKIKVDAGDGNDSLDFTMIKLHKADVTILGGQGNDKVGLNFHKIADHKDSAIDLNVDLGAGDDKFNAIIGAAPGESQGSERASLNFARLNLQGGDGNDNFLIGLLRVENSKIGVESGRGNDTVGLNFIKGESQSVDTTINLGAGNDVASFSWGLTGDVQPTENFSLNFAKIKIDGGDGNDVIDLALVKLHKADINVLGGAGNDRIGLEDLKIADHKHSSLDLNLDLGAGDDQFAAMIGAAPGESQGTDKATLNFARLNLLGGDGNDNFLIGLLRVENSRIGIDAGRGNDMVGLNFIKGESQSVDTTINLGDGNDVASFSWGLTGALNPNDNFTLNFSRIKVDGGQGNDLIDLALVKLHKADINVEGGAGNDVISMNLSVAPGGVAPVDFSAIASGGDGNDSLAMSVFGAEGLRSLFAMIDGGAGMDIHRSTPNVQLKNVEDVSKLG